LITQGEIEVVVGHYREKMARYEEAASVLEHRLRRELRAAAIKTLVLSRAKHPDEVRRDLEYQRATDDPAEPELTYTKLNEDLNRAITDLSRATVIVYHPIDEQAAFEMVLRRFPLADVPNPIEHQEDRLRGSRALVEIDETFDRPSVQGSIVEVQVASISSHIFNELGADIGYRQDQGEQLEGVAEGIEELMYLSRLTDRAVQRLMEARRTRLFDPNEPLQNPVDLRHALEQQVGHTLTGDFQRLFRLLDSVIHPFTAGALAALGNAEKMLEKGVEIATGLGLHETGGDDDVLCYTLALMPAFGPEFQELAKNWRGPTNDIKNAILGWKDPG
jgi:ppGpp synthetase/RelA/SpoT-type nucleotidyltranferase